jgi:predicted amidophosphoribosyltransferase
MILLHKERGIYPLARPLGEMLAGPVRAALAADGRTLLVPVPSRPTVVRARGHDAVLRLVRVAPLLRQRDLVADQAGLSSTQRAENVSGRIAVTSSGLHALARSGVPVAAVVCDDVITTGATSREAQRALSEVGVPVAAVCCVAATQRRVRPSS